MDIETVERCGNKRVHHRLSSQAEPDRTNYNVCFNWRAGRCNRFHCPCLHSNLRQPSDGFASKWAASGDDGGFHSQGLIWRNSNSSNKLGPASRLGKSHQGAVSGISRPRKIQDKICHYFVAGTCSYGENCIFLHSWFVGDSISLLTPLKGHQKGVAGFALPAGSDKLYTGSKDDSVRLWDCQTGQCAGVINLGGEVGCMIGEGPWIFVGIPNAIKAWNMQSASDLTLSGPTGQVYAMAVVMRCYLLEPRMD